MSETRLKKEYAKMIKSPTDGIVARPLPNNILEWHYVIQGPKGSPYEGGFYHGKLTFPPEYPLKPPSIQMITPSGRFETNKRICLSMSDFHPETWNPMWSTSSVLVGLLSFMLQNNGTVGSITTNTAYKRSLARDSVIFNLKSARYRKLFPKLSKLHKAKVELMRKQVGRNKVANKGIGATHGDIMAVVNGEISEVEFQFILKVIIGLAVPFVFIPLIAWQWYT